MVAIAATAGAGGRRGGEGQSPRGLARRPWASGETTEVVLHKRARLVNGSWSQTVSIHACVDGVSWVLAAVAIATAAGPEGTPERRKIMRRVVRRPFPAGASGNTAGIDGRQGHTQESTFGAPWLARCSGVFGGVSGGAGREGEKPLPSLGARLNSAGTAPRCYSCGVPDLAVLPPLAPLDSASKGNRPKSKEGAAETPWEIEGAPRTLWPCYI